MPETTRQWDGRGKGSSAGNRFFMWLIRRFGVLPAYVFLLPACLSYALFDRALRAGVRALRAHLGQRAGLFTFYRHVYSFGMSLVDRFAFLLLRKPPFAYECRGEETIARLAAERHGVILASAHVGNWEIAGSLLQDHLGLTVNVALLDAEREALQRVYAPALAQRRFNTIPMTPGAPDTAVALMARLRAGEIVCLLADRVHEGRSAEAQFLGAPAKFPVGPFALAAATGAPVVPVFVTKAGLLRYRFQAGEPVILRDLPNESREAAVNAALRSYVAALERIVREHPSQWYNFFDFWGGGEEEPRIEH